MPIEMRGQGAGKPQRGSTPAKVTTLRLDIRAITLLKREFGSLGNACYYLYESLVDYKAKRDQGELEETAVPHMKRALLTAGDLTLISDALANFSVTLQDKRVSTPYVSLLKRINAHIAKEDPEPYAEAEDPWEDEYKKFSPEP